MKTISLAGLFFISWSSLIAQISQDTILVPVLRYDEFCKNTNAVILSSHNNFIEAEDKELVIANRDLFTSRLKFEGTYSTSIKSTNTETHFLGIFYEGKKSIEADSIFSQLKHYLTNCLGGSYQMREYTDEQINTLSDGTIRQYMLVSNAPTNGRRTVIKLISFNDDRLLYRVRLDVSDLNM